MNQLQPLASVIISNYNYGRFLSEAIDSILCQSYQNIEIIVVDDGSTDNSREVIAAYRDKVIPAYQENTGQAKAFNTGFNVSSGDFIFLLDADDTFETDKISTIISLMSEYPQADYCFHAINIFDDTSKKQVNRTPVQGEGVIDQRQAIRSRGKTNIFLPSTSGFCFRRSLLAQLLPMPVMEGITISDKYLGNMAVALATGYYSNKMLANLRLHDSNLYTGQQVNYEKVARIGIATAYWMKEKDPGLYKYCSRLMAKAIAIKDKTGLQDQQLQAFSKKFIKSLNFTGNLYFRAFLLANRIRFSLRSL